MSGRTAGQTGRRIPCTACGVPRFEYCIDPHGNQLYRCHPERIAAARDALDLTPPTVAMPGHRRGKPPKRRHPLTEAGRAAIATEQPVATELAS